MNSLLLVIGIILLAVSCYHAGASMRTRCVSRPDVDKIRAALDRRLEMIRRSKLTFACQTQFSIERLGLQYFDVRYCEDGRYKLNIVLRGIHRNAKEEKLVPMMDDLIATARGCAGRNCVGVFVSKGDR